MQRTLGDVQTRTPDTRARAGAPADIRGVAPIFPAMSQTRGCLFLDGRARAREDPPAGVTRLASRRAPVAQPRFRERDGERNAEAERDGEREPSARARSFARVARPAAGSGTYALARARATTSAPASAAPA